MKPKTVEQKRMLEIVQTFPELTKKERDYFKKHAFMTQIVESRNRLVCSDCGHSWSVDDASKLTKAKCPHCKHHGNVLHNKACVKEIEYFMISEAIEKWQVIRVIQVRRSSQANKIYHWYQDVGAIFYDEKGNATEFSLSRFTMSWIRDAWSFDSEIELRNKSYNVLQSLGVGALLTYSVMPTLKRNGYNGEVINNDCQHLISKLLTDPKFESLWKIGHKGVVAHLIHSYRSLLNDKEERLLKIATRHNIIFKMREEWVDFLDFIKDLEYLNKDIFNPSIVFPENFAEAHQVWHERAETKRQKERERAERQRRIEEHNRAFVAAQQDEAKKQWIEFYTTHFGTLNFERNGYRFKALVTVKDFEEEANVMQHCIRSYYGKNQQLLLSISYNGEKQETAQIDMRTLEIIQCRGRNNQSSQHHDTIVYLLKQYKRIFKAYYDGKFLKYANKKNEEQQNVDKPNQQKAA